MSSNNEKPKPSAHFDATTKVETVGITFSGRDGRYIHFYPFDTPTIVIQNVYNQESLFINSQEKFHQLWEKLQELFDTWI